MSEELWREQYRTVRDTLLSVEIERDRYRKIVDAAIAVVNNPAWAGICDEDVDLELALREAGEI